MNQTPSRQLHLPLAYEAVALVSGASVRQSAVQMAAEGAGEGTLVWATEQPDDEIRPGRIWYAPDQGLYLALVLEPEFEPDKAGEIALVGLVSLGLAMAEKVMPMTELRYRWPNDILLSGSKVAGLGLVRDLDAGWLVLHLNVNVGKEPEQVFDAGCVQIEGGNPEVTPEDLLEEFARQFLEWINLWDEQGPGPLVDHIRRRHDGEGTPVMLRLHNDEAVAGTLVGVNDAGGLEIELDEKRRTVRLNEFFGL